MLTTACTLWVELVKHCPRQFMPQWEFPCIGSSRLSILAETAANHDRSMLCARPQRVSDVIHVLLVR